MPYVVEVPQAKGSEASYRANLLSRLTKHEPDSKKKRPGRKRVKKESSIMHEPFRWPEGADRCPPDKRVDGRFKLQAKKRTGSVLEMTWKGASALFKRVGISQAQFCYAFETEAQALDTAFSEPGVSVFYRWGNKDHFVAVDCHTRAAANLKACIEIIEGYHRATRYVWAATDFKHRESFLEHRIVEREPERLPSKAKLMPLVEWAQILEIPGEKINMLTGLPFDRQLPGFMRNKLRWQYHPDARTSPQDEEEGASFQRIEDAFAFVMYCFEELDKMSEKEREAKENARRDAAQRVLDRKRKEAEELEATIRAAEPSDDDLEEIEAEDEDYYEDEEDDEDGYVHYESSDSSELFDEFEEDDDDTPPGRKRVRHYD